MGFATVQHQGQSYAVCIQEERHSCGPASVVTASCLLTGTSRSERELIQASKDGYVSDHVQLRIYMIGLKRPDIDVSKKTDLATMSHELEKLLHLCGHSNVRRGIADRPELSRMMQRDLNPKCCYIVLVNNREGRHWVVFAKSLSDGTFVILDPFYGNSSKYRAPQICDSSLDYEVNNRFGARVDIMQATGRYLAVNVP